MRIVIMLASCRAMNTQHSRLVVSLRRVCHTRSKRTLESEQATPVRTEWARNEPTINQRLEALCVQADDMHRRLSLLRESLTELNRESARSDELRVALERRAAEKRKAAVQAMTDNHRCLIESGLGE